MAVWYSRDDDGSSQFIDYPLHDCTEEDLANFYPHDEVSKAIENKWDSLLQINLEATLKCLDKNAYNDIIQIPKGTSKLSIYLVPCDNLPWGPYEVGQECIADK